MHFVHGGSVSIARVVLNELRQSTETSTNVKHKSGPRAAKYGRTDAIVTLPVHLTNFIRVPAFSQLTLQVRSYPIGLSFMEAKRSIVARHGIWMTNEVAELDPRKEFDIIVANIKWKQRTLPRNTVTGYPNRNPLLILTITREVAEECSWVLCITKSTECRSPQSPSIPNATTSTNNKAPRRRYNTHMT